MLLPRGEGAVAPPTPIAAETAPACRTSHELTQPFLTIEERRSAIAYFAAMVCGNALRPPLAHGEHHAVDDVRRGEALTLGMARSGQVATARPYSWDVVVERILAVYREAGA